MTRNSKIGERLTQDIIIPMLGNRKLVINIPMAIKEYSLIQISTRDNNVSKEVLDFF